MVLTGQWWLQLLVEMASLGLIWRRLEGVVLLYPVRPANFRFSILAVAWIPHGQAAQAAWSAC
jgi:hypothetical protein